MPSFFSSFTGFHWVLPSFTAFSMDSPSFTGFYVVLPSTFLYFGFLSVTAFLMSPPCSASFIEFYCFKLIDRVLPGFYRALSSFIDFFMD